MKRAGSICLIAALVLIASAGNSFGGIYSGGSGIQGEPYQIGNVEDILEMSETDVDWDKHFVMIADVNMVDYTFTTAVVEVFTGVFDGAGHKIFNLTIDTGGEEIDDLGLFGMAHSCQIRHLGLKNVSITGGDGSWWLGGLCGINFGMLSNCYTSGSVVGGDDSWDLGGLCGENYGLIINCYSRASVTGDSYVGGLCGSNPNGTIINCYATGRVNGRDNSSFLGGLCGENISGMLSNCYSTGSVRGGSYSGHLGGLCGYNENGAISNCYSIGPVTGGEGSTALGGLCGYQYGNSAEMENSFWDTDTSSMSIGYNLDSTYPGTVTNVLDKTTSEMQTKDTFTNAGWDFDFTWSIDEEVNYPKLRRPYPGDFDFDSDVDLGDFSIFSSAWLSGPNDLDSWNPYCNLYDPEESSSGGTFDPNDAVIDIFDFAVFADNWLVNAALVGYWSLNVTGGGAPVDFSVYGKEGQYDASRLLNNLVWIYHKDKEKDPTGYLGIPRCSSPMCVCAYPHSLEEHGKKEQELWGLCKKNLQEKKAKLNAG
jgi:hypothetical protein